MGKKRKVSGKAPSGPKEFNPADSRLGPVNTYEDVADSEDEYFLNRDKIMFDEEPQSKRRRKAEEEEAFLEPSDEEVLGMDDDESEDEDDQPAPRKAAKAGHAASGSESEGEGEEGDEHDAGWWGPSKKEYYNADEIATEADALEEEAEAKRLQTKRLAKMTEEDFIFDEQEWLTSKDADAEEHDVVTEVLKDIEVTDDMGPEERSRLLNNKYPEIEYLATEFQELQPQLVMLQKEATGKSGKSIEAVKYWILGCYVAALASYFAILTSPARDNVGIQKPLDPAELRDHEIMETLVTCRDTWQKVKHMKVLQAPASPLESPSPEEIDLAMPDEDGFSIPTKQEVTKQRKKKKADKAKQKHAKEVEDSLADLDDLLQTKTKKAKKAVSIPAIEENDHSDFGEEDALDARTAADKAARKKSLRFYTSQIVQKASRRADAGRDAGGDVDIPYRERLRDRQARLNADAERRGKKDSKFGADLGADDSNDEDAATASALRNGDDEYYDMVASSSRKKKDDKAARYEALAAATKADRIVEQEVVGEDGKRKISYVIQKNKGLTPHRKKENRNPRVKKRMQYEDKQKKMRSQKATWKGGEPKGGYGGELSGITTGLVRARKL